MRAFSLLLLTILSISNSNAEIDISNIQSGNSVTQDWLGMPVIIYKRTKEEIKSTQNSTKPSINKGLYSRALQHTAKLYGNEFATGLYSTASLETTPSRSLNPEILVVLGISSYHGCHITFSGNHPKLIDPCSNAMYDSNGRIKKANEREYYHLLVPPHYYEGNKLYIGHKTPGNISTIDFSPNIESMNVSTGEKLLLALEWRKIELIKKLTKKPTAVQYQTKVGATALHIAAHKAKPDIVKILLSAGFDINKPTKSGVTPIQLALLSNNEETAVFLLKNNAKTNGFCQNELCAVSATEFLTRSNGSLTTREAQNYLNKLKEKAL